MPNEERVRIETVDGIADVRMVRGDKMNAVDLDMFVALIDAGLEIAEDKKIRVVVLSGEGRAFCSGLDIPSLMSGGVDRSGPNLLDRTPESPANIAQRCAWVWQEVPVPVIAAVHGVAYGAGFQIAMGADIRYDEDRMKEGRNFATKLWNAARFCEMNGCAGVADFDPKSCRQTLNRWIIGEAERAAQAVGAGIETHRYNEAAGAIYKFVWNVFCDWYLELSKPVLSGDDDKAKAESRATAAWTLDQILKLLHPFMPFLTEELWARTGAAGPARESLLIVADWPVLDGLADAAADGEIGWLIDLISQIRSVRMEINVPAGAMIPLVLVAASEAVRSRADRYDETIRRMARLETISFNDAPPQGAVQLVLAGATAALPLAGIIDFKEERARLERDIAKIDGEIGKIAQKLDNENFIARAPAHVIDEQRDRKSEAQATRERLSDALKRLQGAA